MFDDDGICNDDSDSDDDHGDSDDEAAEEVNEDDDVEELEEEESDEVDAGEESAGHSKPTGGTSNAAAAGFKLKNAVLFGLYPGLGAMPDELKELTYVELSMVAPVNSMTKLHLSGAQWQIIPPSNTTNLHHDHEQRQHHCEAVANLKALATDDCRHCHSANQKGRHAQGLHDSTLLLHGSPGVDVA